MKIIFLDIDGVLATANDFGVGKDKNEWDAYRFDAKCVKVLNEILEETDAEIILSSDWKKSYTLLEMRGIFAHNGVIKGPIGVTPNSQYYADGFLEGGRGYEIKQWIQLNCKGMPVGDFNRGDFTWVAIDDLKLDDNGQDDFFEKGLNFVECPRVREGIKQSGIKEKILKILKNGKN